MGAKFHNSEHDDMSYISLSDSQNGWGIQTFFSQHKGHNLNLP